MMSAMRRFARTILAVMIACGGSRPVLDRAHAQDAGASPPADAPADTEPKTASESPRGGVVVPETGPLLPVLHHDPGVDVLNMANSMENMHGIGQPWLFQAVVELDVRDRAHHAIEVDHLSLVVNECGPLVRGGNGVHEVVRKRSPIVIRQIRLYDAMGEHVLASGKRIVLPAAEAEYGLHLGFDTTKLGDICGDLAFEVKLAIDGDRFEVTIPIGIPDDPPRPEF
jgi:hypothetical protein